MSLTTIGRMGVGLDEGSFDSLPVHELDLTSEDVKLADIMSGDDPPPVGPTPWEPSLYEEPVPDSLPALKAALTKHASKIPGALAVRIDDEKSFRSYVTKRLDELEALVRQHLEEHKHYKHPGYALDEDVLGAVEALREAKTASSPAQALKATTSPALVDLPAFAEGKVQCWREGNHVVCSMRFMAVDGKPRTATAAALVPLQLPEEDSDVDETVLGVAWDLAECSAANKLVSDVAGAALEAARRLDVYDQRGKPVVLVRGAAEGAAAAAVTELEAKRRAGDKQADEDMKVLEKTAATSPRTQNIIAEARRRLAKPSTYAERYAMMAMCM